MQEAFSVETSDGVLSGPVRAPRNSAKHLGAGSIHDDATARKLGFRGGTVAGSLHMEQFPPLLAACFGDDWFASGGMSLYFRYATSDGEPVQAFAQAPESAASRTAIWMDDVAGHRVADGSANVGGTDAVSTVRERLSVIPQPHDIRILAGVEAGHSGARVASRVGQDALEARLAVITEPLRAYTADGPFGKPIATPALQVRAFTEAQNSMLPRNRNFGVGLFGAIELQSHAGPVFIEHDYEAQATVLAVGETPKTEYLFYEAKLFEPGADDVVLSMIMMLRFMKASSDLWSDQASA